ncbi:MAG: protein-L-isoaspartate O-methyltransferase family protein [Spirochaetota bacterium]
MRLERFLFVYSTLALLCAVCIFSPVAAAQEAGQEESGEPETGLTPVQLRAMFLPDFLQDFADTNAPLPTSPTSAVPSVECVQNCFESLQLAPGDSVYIIGQGTGFLAAFFARNGVEVSVSEDNDELLRDYQAVWQELGLSGITQVDFRELTTQSSPRRFDAVLIHASVRTIPETVTMLLAENGTLIAPVSNPQDTQIIIKMRKTGEGWSINTLDEQFFPSGSLDLKQEN